MDLRHFFTDLHRLNPDYPVEVLDAVRAEADVADSSDFAYAAQQTEEIIQLYLDSPQKSAGNEILQEYYTLLEAEERRLIAQGETADLPPVESAQPASSSVALVPRRDVPPLTRCIVLNRSQIPWLVTKAADSYRRRNIILDTVIEIAVDLLWRIDPAAADEWMLQYIIAHEGVLDPDVIRDFLRVALRQKRVSQTTVEWAIKWCGDARLLENWPNVVYTGDRLVCKFAIRRWFEKNPRNPRNSTLALLALLAKQNKFDDKTLLHWVESALEFLADCILRILALKDNGKLHEQADFDGALFSEIQRICSIFPPIMMAGNQLLAQPDGITKFALAVFGLAGESLHDWEEHLNDFCARTIRRWFIRDLAQGKSPVDTIRRLTFGNDDAFRSATAQLDLVTQRFDSMKQRERVIQILVPFYASYRQDKLLATEITRRFRKIFHILHEDFLSQVLSQTHLNSVRQNGVIFSLASLIGDARKYLDRRRNAQLPLENAVASKIEFEESTRKLRLEIIRNCLGTTAPEVSPSAI